MKRGLVVIFVIALLLSTLSFANAVPSGVLEKRGVNIAERGCVPTRVVVKFKPGVSNWSINELVSRQGCLELYRSPLTETFVLEIPADKAVDGMLKRFRQESSVAYAQPNYVCSAFMTPDDPLYSDQWNFEMIHMEQAWDIEAGGSPSVVVAVLDTGVAYENYGARYRLAPDLAGTTFVAGYDFINDDAHPNDDNSHGTHVTGTIAETTNNAVGVAGIAFNTAIMPVKVLGKSGSGTDQTLADGVIWAVDHGAQVISMSLGFDPSLEPADLPTLTSAVEYAHEEGVILVASSGNDGVGAVSLPAAYPEVIAVGAVHSGGELASYSNYGDALDFVAPGGDGQDRDGDGYVDGVLQQTFNPNTKNPSDFGYWFFSGTSMAAPHVSGVVALIIANGNADTDGDGESSPDEIMDVLQVSATDLGAAGRDNFYGWGLIDAEAALQPRLRVNVRGSGLVTQDPDQASYAPGTEVGLTASASAGWTFAGWSGDLSGTTNPNSIVMDADKAVTAAFTPQNPVLLSGWAVDSSLTNAPYSLESVESGLSLELEAVDINSRVTVYSLDVPSLDLSGFDHIDVAVTGTSNAMILLRFFMDNGEGFDVAYWFDPATIDAISFDLSAYAGRTLTVAYLALMSSDGSVASIDVAGIALVTETPAPVVSLSGWMVDSSLTNAPYMLDGTESSLSLMLDAADTNSRVTIYTVAVPSADLGDFDHLDVAVTGSATARVLLRFFMDNGAGFDVTYWADPETLDAVNFDLSSYTGRTLTVAYLALMSSDGLDASIDITGITLVAEAPAPEVPLAGWAVDFSLTNALYTLSSTQSSLSLALDASDANSRVTVYSLALPSVDLADYDHIDVSVTGTANAKILMRFFLDDGSGFDVVYWGNAATLDAISFDLSTYAGRTLTVAYIALMSSDGANANIEITQIALAAAPPPPEVPLAGWSVEGSLTNAPYTLSSTASELSLELDASDTSSRVTIYTLGVPAVDLEDYDHIDVTVTGTSNARILLRFFMDNGAGFDVTYWADPETLDAVNFDLSPYAGRTLTVAYLAVMSSNGEDANIDLTQIALIT